MSNWVLISEEYISLIFSKKRLNEAWNMEYPHSRLIVDGQRERVLNKFQSRLAMFSSLFNFYFQYAQSKCVYIYRERV